MANRKYGAQSSVEWVDRKRWCGLPLTLTQYALVSNPDWSKIFVNTGLLSTKQEEINLYRIYDIVMTTTLINKLFGVGSITLYSKDESMPVTTLYRIKNPYQVRNLLAGRIEQEKAKRGFRVAEFN